MADIDMSILKFDDKGLIPTVVQDAADNAILMVAYMNKESLQHTVDSGVATYWSRSRQKLWKKGESSGHIQKVKSMRTDCDGDVILIQVEQVGGAACHTGNRSCFYKERQENGTWKEISKPLFNPEEVYKKK